MFFNFHSKVKDIDGGCLEFHCCSATQSCVQIPGA